MITRRQTIVGVGALAITSAIPGDGVALTSMGRPHNNFPKLHGIVAEIDARYGGVDGAPYVLCQTGEKYATIVSGGIKEECEPCPMLCDNPDDAIDAWCAAFLSYVSDRPPYPSRLYWRARPTAEIIGDDWGHEKWVVYSRLIITDKPELPAAEFRARMDYERNSVYDSRTGERVGDVRDPAWRGLFA